MQYGAMNFPVMPVIAEIEAFAGLGFDYLELTMDPPQAHYTIIQQHKDRIMKVLNRYSMGVMCHLPTFVYTADLAESIRKASVDEIMKSLDAAAEIGVRKAVLHPSMASGLSVYVIDIVKEYFNEFLGEVVAQADRKGITLCLENMFPRYHSFFEPEDFVKVFEQFPSLRLTLDVGHANIGDKNGRRSLDFIEMFGDRIGHIHVSDNEGKRDDHIPVGRGTVNFPRIIKSLKNIGYADTVTFEIFTEERYDLKSSRERFNDMLG
ncbi:MAG: sugar phosphate isomerase/epimerase [Desulfobacterales bacterium]|nr:sugar phosphate isomerase/epimerase [Desulfobacterales bacterium]